MELQNKPSWLKVRLPGWGQYYEVRRQLDQLKVHTVCEAARCPNAAECWGGGTATFMILGEICSRGCRFCAVHTGHPVGPPAADEPQRLAVAVETLALRYVVLTSVDRDDLADGGAGHFAATVAAITSRCPATVVELLTPDFGGEPTALCTIIESGAQVLGHNLETTRSLTPQVRDPRCSYDLSLQVLQTYRARARTRIIKSSLLLGLGESDAEIQQSLADLRAAGVDWVTLGQYLRPTRKHLPIKRYVEPNVFDAWAEEARTMGFSLVTAGPLVRSSYRAAEEHATMLLQQRQKAGAGVRGR